MEALVEKIPSEYIGGVKYRMSPTSIFHYMASDNLAEIIKKSLDKSQFFLAQDVGLIPCEGDIVYPDLAVYEKPIKYTESGLMTDIPLFVTEILSPSTRKKDLTVKKDLYERIGVEEYWLVSPQEKAVEVYKMNEISQTYNQLDNVYTALPPEEWMTMTTEEKEEHPHITKIDCVDVAVDIWDIFKEA